MLSKYSMTCDTCINSEYKGMLFCKNCFQNRTLDINDSEINKISDKVFLGNEEGALDSNKLKELGITHILMCGKDLIKFHENDFKYKQVEVEDDTNEDIKKYFKESITFIESSKRIYVHCWAGVSRSASFVIAYFMWKKRFSFEEAKIFVMIGRECIDPNEGFQKQLKEFEQFLKENDYKLSTKKKKK